MELVGRIFAAIQRFSPSEQWNFDAILQILKESGGYVRQDIISAVCGVVSRSETMQQYAVGKLQSELAESSTVQPLVQVAAWILGEYGEDNEALNETFSQILVLPQTTKETKGYVLTALAKLASRSSVGPIVLDTLANEAKENDLDLQQRAGEFLQILTKTQAGESLLAPAPPVEEDEEEAAKPANVQRKNEQQPAALDNWMTSNEQVPAAVQDDLLGDLLGDMVGPSPTSSNQQQSNKSLLSDLLDEMPSQPQPQRPAASPQPVMQQPAQQQPMPQQQQTQQKVPPNLPPGAKQIYNSSGIQIYLEVNKANGNPNMMAFRTSVFNFSAMKITNLQIKFQAPEGWVSNYQPPTGDSIESQGKPVLQISQWVNNGLKLPGGVKYQPMMLRMNLIYNYGTMPTKETVDLPPSLFA
ncbi:hypothetical protein TRFO_40767 [Tritrichomonas foetus]|uniref:GAE domain-containing protein n=1 Tax=Tritrichomonas foetus TaxID=1144522 RepID=A0A1J4J430_9EUKA|nr:hypothetical protein TRFO_40767 [Tritrichomonas foetus]|eukprot:OHS92911.1 hypothetical protein TRFO_40767 [Tritrichomonas foetus]